MFKSSKKIALLAVAGAALLSASGSALAQGQGKKIGLAVANLQAEFFNMIKQSVEAYGKEKGYTIITVDAKGDATTQVNQIQDLIAQKIDALIYIPAGATAAAVPVKAARAAHIPVVNVDRNADGAPGDNLHPRRVDQGDDRARRMDLQADRRQGRDRRHPRPEGHEPRGRPLQGFLAGLAKCPAMKVVANQWSERWAADEGAKIGQDMLQRDPQISVIFGQADGLALGASQAVKLAKPDHKVWVVGYDGDVGGLKAVQSGGLDATVTQPTFTMGRLAVDAVTDLLAGKKVPFDQPKDGVLTTKENVESFLKQHP